MTGINPLGNMNMNALFAPMGFDSINASAFSAPLFSFGGFTPSFNMDFSQGMLDTTCFKNFDFNSMWDDFMAAIFKPSVNINTTEYVDDGKLAIDLSLKYGSTEKEYADEDTKEFTYDSKQLKDKWSKKKTHLSDGFYNKVVEISKRLNCDPNDLMCLMNSESGLNPSAVNPDGGATGLIQFMPKTAKLYGTTTEALKNMSAEEQLVYAEKFLTNAKKQAKLSANDKVSSGTLYAMVFLPALSSKNVLASKGDRYYEAGQNRALDIDKDGVISKNDLAKRLHRFDA